MKNVQNSFFSSFLLNLGIRPKVFDKLHKSTPPLVNNIYKALIFHSQSSESLTVHLQGHPPPSCSTAQRILYHFF